MSTKSPNSSPGVAGPQSLGALFDQLARRPEGALTSIAAAAGEAADAAARAEVKEEKRRRARTGPSLKTAIGFVEDALAIRGTDAGTANTVGFMARMLVQATMPHSKTSELSYKRTNGAVTVKMVADPDVGLPFGTYPRLILAWITTEAVQTRSPTLVLGDSLSSWMREMGMEVRGGPRGSITFLRNHLQRLFSSSISWTYSSNHGELGVRVHPVEATQLWWDPRQPAQIGFWQSKIQLNQRFFEALIERPVPVDKRALCVLAKARSPLALDLYTWLTYRLKYLSDPTCISWSQLQLQFGGDYTREVDFRRKFGERLRLVQQVYPAAKVVPTEKGLVLQPSPSHVPARLARGQ